MPAHRGQTGATVYGLNPRVALLHRGAADLRLGLRTAEQSLGVIRLGPATYPSRTEGNTSGARYPRAHSTSTLLNGTRGSALLSVTRPERQLTT
jgi:hypothetical protein